MTLPDILEKNRKEVIYDIKQQVNIGLMNGDRYETTAKKVAERLDISYGKATNIVRTETHRVTESGFMDCAKDISDSLDGSGLVYTAAWRTMKDERVRPQHRYRTKSGWKTSISRNGANHQKMEGVIIQVGDKFQLEPNVYAECPSTSGTARNDCRCRCFLEYTLMSVEKFEELTAKSVDKSGGSGIMNTGAISGALNPYSKAAEKHATQYYGSVRHMKTDTLHISRSTGISQNKIDKIKNHVFISEHDLIDGKRRFDPDYEMAQSWQRLINGNFREQDIVLLKHEYAELRYMEKGFSQYEAHLKASKKYNFAKYCE